MKVSSHDQLQNSIMKIPDASLGGGGEGLLNPQFLVTGTTNFTIPVGFFGIVKTTQGLTAGGADFLVNGFKVLPKQNVINQNNLILSDGFIFDNFKTGVNPSNGLTYHLPLLQLVSATFMDGIISSNNNNRKYFSAGNSALKKSGAKGIFDFWLSHCSWFNSTGVAKQVFYQFNMQNTHSWRAGVLNSDEIAPSGSGSTLSLTTGTGSGTFNTPVVTIPNGKRITFFMSSTNVFRTGIGVMNSIQLFEPIQINENTYANPKIRLREGDVISGGRYVVELYQL